MPLSDRQEPVVNKLKLVLLWGKLGFLGPKVQPAYPRENIIPREKHLREKQVLQKKV